MNKIITLAVIFIFHVRLAYATDIIDYRTRLSRQILTSSSITAIAKDDNGFIWLASRNELVRFDGVSYYNPEQVKRNLFTNDNIVRQLYFQAPGILWICSNNGLYTYDIRKHTLNQVNPLAGIRIYSMLVKRGNMYLNTQNGLMVYQPAANQAKYLYRYDKKNIPLEYTSFDTDTFENCWLSVNNYLLRLPSLLALEKNAALKIQTHPDTVKKFRNNNRIKIDRYNMMWMWDRETLTTATISQQGALKNSKTEEIEISALLLKDNLAVLCNRGKENVWLHRNKDGGITEREVFQINQQYDDLSNTTNIFYPDEDRNIWLGTRDGLFMLPYGEKSKLINIRNDIKQTNTLSHNTVSDIYIEGRNTAWIATPYGLNKIKFTGSAANSYKIERFLDTRASINSVLDNKIERITVSRNGELWLGTKGNLKIYDPKKNSYYSKPVLEQALKTCSFVRALYRDNHDDIWIGFENGGVFHYNRTANTVSAIKTPSSETVKCTAISGNDQGTIWIGTRLHGILRVVKKAGDLTVKQYVITDTLYRKPITVNCIYNDKYNNIWVGAENGLYKYNYEKDEFVHMRINFSEGPQCIAGLISDTRGNLWMATLSGVYKYNISEGNCQLITLYNGNFLRQGFVFGNNIDSDGFIYMSGINGLTIFNPHEIVSDTAHYKVLFTDFRIHNKTAGVDSGILNQDINYSNQIELGHRDNQFSFAFSALTYTNRENIRYSYMLEGIDDDWIFAGPEERYISYNNLPAGKYTLKIRSTNSSGVWQNNIHSLQIKVIPPFYKRWYFYLLYILVAGSVVWLSVYLWGLRVKLKSQTALEQYKLNFYTDLIYSIKTPLTLLQSPMQNIIKHYDVMSDNEIKYMLSTMNRNSSRLALLVEQLMEFRKVSQGKAFLNLTEIDFIPFITGIYENFKDLFESKNIRFEFRSNIQNLLIVFDYEKMETILFNLLSNAYKFTPSGASAELSCMLNSSEYKLWIEIRDTGIGIKKEEQKKIFERFSSGEGGSKTKGLGIGLPLAKELIELHHGQIYLDSLPGNGTSIKFYLQLGRNHFKDIEIGQTDQSPIEYVRMNDYLESESLVRPEDEPYLPNAALVYMVDEDPQIPAFVDKVCRPAIRIKAFDNTETLYQEVFKQKPKLILSALVFEGEKRGLLLCEKIKANPATNDIPFMFVSSHSGADDKTAGYERGADAYIAKPFDVNHLKMRITLLLQSKENIREKVKRELIVNPKEVRLQSADDKFLAKAMELIEKYIADENFSVDQFASRMNFSPSMLYRKIKSLTNLSPNELIRSVRLKRAAQLLRTKAYTVSEVALKVGFADIRYFSSCFKKEFGMPPSVYQQTPDTDQHTVYQPNKTTHD